MVAPARAVWICGSRVPFAANSRKTLTVSLPSPVWAEAGAIGASKALVQLSTSIARQAVRLIT
ncbi:hypothetical protein SALBM311S_04806 [Streptomyces alboniger]